MEKQTEKELRIEALASHSAGNRSFDTIRLSNGKSLTVTRKYVALYSNNGLVQKLSIVGRGDSGEHRVSRATKIGMIFVCSTNSFSSNCVDVNLTNGLTIHVRWNSLELSDLLVRVAR